MYSYDGKPLDGLFVFDNETANWKKIKPRGGLIPGPRCRHNLIALDSKRLLLVGGFYDAAGTTPHQDFFVYHLGSSSSEPIVRLGLINAK